MLNPRIYWFFFKLFVTFHDFLFLKIYTIHYQEFLLLKTLDIILEFLLVKIILPFQELVLLLKVLVSV